MRILHWIITTDCQLSCQYCPYTTGKTKFHFPPAPSLMECEELIAHFAPFFDEVALTGGEPLLHPSILGIVERIREAGMQVSILTNGLSLTKITSKRLLAAGVRRISVSLDSLEVGLNDTLRCPRNLAYRGKSGDKVIANLLKLADIKPPGVSVEVLQTLTHLNVDAVSEMMTFCNTNGLDLFVHPVGLDSKEISAKEFHLEKALPHTLNQLEIAMMAWADSNGDRQEYVNACMALLRGESLAYHKCKAASTRFVLDADSTVYPCFQRFDVCIGNLLHDNPIILFGKSSPHRSRIAEVLQKAPCVTARCVCLVDCRTKRDHPMDEV